MTKVSNQKTFYAKTFEPVLRNYFKWPSKTKTGLPVIYAFLQNKDNKTGFYRTVGKGLSDVVLRSFSLVSKDKEVMSEVKYLTFFPYINKFNGAFTIGKEHWENFIKATDISNEKTIWGVFCTDKDHFILAHNKSKFIRHDVVVETEHYVFDAYEVCPQDYVSFTRSDEDPNDWIVEAKNNIILMKHDNQYNGILPENAECFPLPRIGKKCLFCVNGHFIEDTFTNIANQYHGSDTVDNFITKLRRNKNTNKKQIQKDLRMKAILGTVKVAVIPEDFTETDVIDWQNTHLVENKTEIDGYERVKKQQYRLSRKSDRT
jgi:hypothetical protein